jgi:DNA-binding PadR family transcriptional regulator
VTEVRVFYELIVLGGLMTGPYHGYFLAKVMSDMLGPWQKISTGNLYPLLARMQRADLIAPADTVPSPMPAPPPRQSPRAYAITDAGRQRFREIMLDTRSAAGDYDRLFRIKVLYFQYLAPAECRELIQHYQDYCRAAIRHQQTETADLKNWLDGMHSDGTDRTPFVTAAGLHDAIEVMNHTIGTWQSEYEWAQQLASRHSHDTSPE